MKYPEKQFELYDKNCFSTITGQDLFANRRILICSITRPALCFTQTYIRNIELYSSMYKLLGVDEVYFMIYSKPLLHSLTHRVHVMPILSDYSDEYITWLNAKTNNSTQDINFLKHYWSYQVLINDGEVEQITQQPIKNYLTTMLKETKNVKALKSIGLKNEKLIWTPVFLERSMTLARDIYYYNLHPNTALKKHLFKNS